MAEVRAEPDQHYDRVVDELTDRFAGVHDRDAVIQAVNDARHQLEAHAKVTNYLPVLTQKLARTRLADLGMHPPVSVISTGV
jgi:hypothetical protein